MFVASHTHIHAYKHTHLHLNVYFFSPMYKEHNIVTKLFAEL